MSNGLIAHALIFDKYGKILILKRSKIKRGKPNYQAEKWDIPGGTVEHGELPRYAAVREAKEETGLDIAVKSIIFEKSNFDLTKNKVFTTLVYFCELIDDRNIVLDYEEHSEFCWILPEEVFEHPNDFVDYMLELVTVIRA